jgi:nicotinamide mononucleotide transporter
MWDFALIIELVATLFGLICVILTLKENIWCWPTGLVQVSLFIYVFFNARLYSDMILHIIYVPMQFYGWYNWLHGGAGRGELHVTRLGRRALALWALAAAAGNCMVGYIMQRHTNAALPYWDAAILVLSLIAQWLMSKKKLESFGIWIIVDLLAIAAYTVRGLYPTAALYGAFLILASSGLLAWHKSYRVSGCIAQSLGSIS